MAKFQYVRANNLDEAVTLLSEIGVRSIVIAGGTDLLVQARQGSLSIDRVVDISRITELKVIREEKSVIIGAGVTFTELLKSSIVQTHATLLAQACRRIGSLQIRNRGTIGGNVANAALCADTLPALVCLEADAVIVTASGEKRIPVTDFVIRPHKTQLGAGELIKAFVFDPPPADSHSAFERIGRRRAMVISRLSLAGIGAMNDKGRIRMMRLVPGSAFPWFRRVKVVEEMLLDEIPSEELFIAAGQKMAACFMEVSGKRWSSPYKQKALAAITERSLRQIVGVEK